MATPQIASQQLQRTAFSYRFAIFDDTVDIMASISIFHFAGDTAMLFKCHCSLCNIFFNVS